MRSRLSILLLILIVLSVFVPTALATDGVVVATQLNVRTKPIAGGDSEIITVLGEGDIVNIVGRNADTSFYDIVTPSGVRGWASSAYIYVATPNSGRFAPVTTSEVAEIGVVARGIVNINALNLRTAPDIRAEVITVLRGGMGVNIIGRNVDASWYEVVLDDGRVGWVWSRYLIERGGQGVNAPRSNSDQVASLPAALGTITANRLNVRTLPDPIAPIVRVALGGERIQLRNRNSDSSWYLVEFDDGVVGWVNASWVRLLYGTDIDANVVNIAPQDLPSNSVNVFVPLTEQGGGGGGDATIQVQQNTAATTVSAVNGLVNQPRLNVRVAADPNSAIIDSVGFMTRVYVLGRNSNTSWLYVQTGALTGWVYAPFVDRNVGSFESTPVVEG